MDRYRTSMIVVVCLVVSVLFVLPALAAPVFQSPVCVTMQPGLIECWREVVRNTPAASPLVTPVTGRMTGQTVRARETQWVDKSKLYPPPSTTVEQAYAALCRVAYVNWRILCSERSP